MNSHATFASETTNIARKQQQMLLISPENHNIKSNNFKTSEEDIATHGGLSLKMADIAIYIQSSRLALLSKKVQCNPCMVSNHEARCFAR